MNTFAESSSRVEPVTSARCVYSVGTMCLCVHNAFYPISFSHSRALATHTVARTHTCASSVHTHSRFWFMLFHCAFNTRKCTLKSNARAQFVSFFFRFYYDCASYAPFPFSIRYKSYVHAARSFDVLRYMSRTYCFVHSLYALWMRNVKSIQ